MKRLMLIVIVCLTWGFVKVNSDCFVLNSRVDVLSAKHSCIMPEIPAMIQKMQTSTVLVNLPDVGNGSGVITDRYTIITAGHVIDGIEDCVEDVVILDNNGNKHRVESVARAADNDCGLIRVRDPFDESQITKLADSNSLSVGDTVFAIGTPYGPDHFNTAIMGIVSGVKRAEGFFGKGLYITLDVQGDPGFSGGPVFNVNGEVVGLVVGTRSVYGNGLVITPINIVKDTLLCERTK